MTPDERRRQLVEDLKRELEVQGLVDCERCERRAPIAEDENYRELCQSCCETLAERQWEERFA